MQETQKKQDIRVELLRILACLMVIMIHVRPFPFSGTDLRDAVVLIYVLNGPAVAAFFLISGFFISGKQSIWHVWKRFLTGILLPTAVFVFILGLIRPWIDHPGTGIVESTLSSQPSTILSDMIQGFLCFDTVRFGIYGDHLWYIFSYAGIMLWMPVILVLVKHEETTALKIMLITAVLYYTIQNMRALIPIPFMPTIPEAVGKPTMYAISGYLFYSFIKRLRLSNGHSILYFALIFIISSILLFFIQKQIFVSGIASGRSPSELNTDYYFTSWNGMLCAVQTLGFSGTLLLLPEKLFKGNISAVISAFGSFTFPIYLIHYVFTNHFRAIGVEELFRSFFGESSAGLILYSFIYSLFVFAFCSLLIFIYKEFRKYTLCLIQRTQKKNQTI